MQEIDLIWMSLLIFIPTIFALGLLLFPKGTEEWMRWWSLFGTALTLGLSLCMFIFFTKGDLLHRSADSAVSTTLNERVDRAFARGNQPRERDDFVARYDWIKPFDIEYYLGADGISMALILLTT